MPSDIEVTEQSAKVLVTDLDSVSGTLSSAYLCVQIYVRSDCSGGVFLTNAGSTLNSVREQLGDQYRDLSTKTSDAATTALAIWKDFETRDEQAREKFAQIQAQGTPWPMSSPGGLGQSDGPLDQGYMYDGKLYFPPAAVTSYPQPAPATPQVDPVSLGGKVTHPQTDDGWISTLDAWDGIKDRIDEIIGYEWLTGPLEKVGIHTYLDQFAHYMEGNYDEWAQGLGAVEALGSYFDQLSTDLGQSRDQLASHWYGEASTAIQTWLDHLAGASSTHATALNLWSSQIADEAIECKLLLDQVLDLLGDLADLIPVIEINGDGLIEKGLSLLTGAAEAALKAVYAAVKLVAKMVTRFEVLFDLCWTFIDLLSHSGKSLDFPAVSNPTPP